MDNQKSLPHTDDFRLERDARGIVVTFTPDGRSYTFPVEGDRLGEAKASPARAEATHHAEEDVRKAAAELARLALNGGP